MNLPNWLTFARVLLIPMFVTAFVYGQVTLATGIFIAASLTDLMDGYLARTRYQETELGKLLDPVADKCLLLTAFTLLRACESVPAWMLIVVFSREAIVVGGWILRHLITQRSNVVTRVLGKATIVFQSVAVTAALMVRAGAKLDAATSVLLHVALAVTAASGLEYLYRGVKELGPD